MTKWSGGTVGYIGLGNMGQPMVIHLVESDVPVMVFDVVAQRVDAVVVKGARAAGGLAAMVVACDVIVMSLPDPAAVQKVMDQIFATPRAGVTIVDLTTSDAALSQAMNEKAKAAGMQFVDAPVSGGPVRSADGSLTIMIGGEDRAVQAAMPVLNVLGKHLVQTGGPGMGNVAKLVHNMVSLSNILTVSEALLLAEKAGLPAKQITEILSTGTANSAVLSRVAPKILNGDFKPGMTLTIAHKDISLAVRLGQSVGLPLRMGAQTEKLIDEAIAAGLGELDVSGMHEAIKLPK